MDPGWGDPRTKVMAVGHGPDVRRADRMEMARGDGSMGTFLVVHGGLAMRSIVEHGSEEQKQTVQTPWSQHRGRKS